jgi:hypothetical protein
MGSRIRLAGTAQAHWGLAVEVVLKGKGGERALAGHRPWASPSSQVQLDTTRGWIFAKILPGLHREGQGRYTPLVGLFENEREKREKRERLGG